MSNPQFRNDLIEVLHAFGSRPLAAAARDLLAALGYRSENAVVLDPNTAEEFVAIFDTGGRLDAGKALLRRWLSVDMIAQVTGEEIGAVLHSQPALLHESSGPGGWQSSNIHSYLFFAIDLAPAPDGANGNGGDYTRTQLAAATREINKLFLMPAMVIFRHGASLTVAIIARRQHKKDAGKDVLEKVTLIKGIRYAQPHRAHVEILADLALPTLARDYGVDSFTSLQAAWEKALDTAELNKRFYKEIADWYFWAIDRVTFPDGAGEERATANATSVIRLITRLIFVWFLKEKGLAPEALFRLADLENVLTWDDPKGSTYYKAILQNLFFATLNTWRTCDEKDPDKGRRFRQLNEQGRSGHYGIHSLYRYQALFRDPDGALALFADIPFLNGGLFECLDRVEKNETAVRIDGFSDRPDNPLVVPDELFFSPKHPVDLNAQYGAKGQNYQVRGLLDIFDSYKFTVEENTPIEEEVALDPELLGKVFENLLAAYNPETGETARKQTGSFYTPRNIVDYMVDESLLVHLARDLQEVAGEAPTSLSANVRRPPPGGLSSLATLRDLLAYTSEPHALAVGEAARVITAIDNLKIIDPACGSGAFPMGVLHKLVFLLRKLDPHNEGWQRRQLEKAAEIPDTAAREAAEAAIREVFAHNDNDYGRKLYLIENCIYGVDIQPIAVQIAKLRCFISLIVDQKEDARRPNRGIRALPNLETKFVAANTLIGIERPPQMAFRNPEVEQVERQLAAVRRHHFDARSKETKEKYRQQDKQLRERLVVLLEQDGWPKATAGQLASWDPYNQNAHAEFFDPEWMFGITDGFDVVIGNPPYVRQEKIRHLKPVLGRQYTCYTGTADLYVYFFERGLQLLRPGGVLTYICSNKYFRAAYGGKLRSYLAGETRLRQLIDFGDEPVFTAIAYPSIMITQHSAPGDNQVRVYTWPDGAPLDDFAAVFAANSFDMPQRELTADGWRLESAAVLRLIEKMRAAGKPLGEYVNGGIYYGIKTGLNEAFVIDRSTRDYLVSEHPSSAEVLKPFLRGRDVKRWSVESQDMWLIFTRHGTNIEKYPAILKYLSQFKTKLMPGVPGGRKPGSYKWYEIQDNVAYWPMFSEPKIIWRAVAEEARGFGYDSDGYLSTDTTYILPTVDKSLFAFLNSSLCGFFLGQLCDRVQAGYLRVKSIYLEQVPIAELSAKDKARLSCLVDQILAAKAKDPTADVSASEAEIDRLVYALYGLTEEEIAVVEGMG